MGTFLRKWLSALAFLSVIHLKAEVPNAIFTRMDQPDYGLRGEVRGVQTQTRIVAFLARLDSAFPTTAWGLLSPTYQIPVKDGKFEFRFLASGDWILGAYEDRNGNLLLDLPKERFVISGMSPLRIPCRDCNYTLDFDFTRPLEVEIKGPTENLPMLWQLLDTSGNALMTLSGKPRMNLPWLGKPILIRPFLDLNQDGKADQDEYSSKPSYGPISDPRNVSPISYGQPWQPFELTTFHKPDRLEVCLLQEPELTEVECTRKTFIQLRDLPSGTYVPEFLYPWQGDSLVFRLPPVSHSGSTSHEVQFLQSARIELENPYEMGFVDIWHENTLVGQAMQTELGDFPLPVQGHYHFVFYREFTNPDPLSPFMKSHVEVFPLQPVANSTFSITLSQPAIQRYEGILQHFYPGLEGQLIFWQESGFREIPSTLSIQPLAPATQGFQPIEIPLQGDATHFFALDLNSDGVLSPQERKIHGHYDRKSLDLTQNYLKFDPVLEGKLTISLSGFEGNAWVQIFGTNVSEPLRSDMATEAPANLLFSGLPLGNTLRIEILQDRNRSNTVDEEDVVHPPIPLILPYTEPIKFLNLSLPEPEKKPARAG